MAIRVFFRFPTSVTVTRVGLATSFIRPWTQPRWSTSFPVVRALSNGQFLLIVEVFDEAGNRLVPTDAPSPPSGTDKTGTFHYLRLIDSTTNAYVPYNSLTHVLWVDNRRTMGHFDYFMNPTGTQTCQFYQEQ
jgi:hypothetical protein